MMKKSLTVMAMVIALAMSSVSLALAGAGDKATGSGEWSGIFMAEFNAHEEVVGKNGNVRPAKGELFQARIDGGGEFYVDVDEVVIGDGYACFAGMTYGATGLYESYNGENRWTYVTEGDGPGDGTFRGTWSATPPRCLNGTVTDDFAFTDGNVTIHSGKAYTD